VENSELKIFNQQHFYLAYKWIFSGTVFLAVLGLSNLLPPSVQAANPKVVMEIDGNRIVLELYPEKAPKTVANFLAYVRSGYYDNLIFHRVIKGFMIQGGGFTPQMQRKATSPPIPNEADNGLKNQRGTIAMARTSDPHSATAQFFINLVDNRFLDHRARNPQGWGYCVFGKVVEGMQVVDEIAKQPTTTQGNYRDVPQTAVIIKKAYVPEAQNTSTKK
jgi:cyclophilin family peptidyl-prolyl cis-trans isomerase